MLSEELQKAKAVLQVACETWEEGLIHSTDDLVAEVQAQLMRYQEQRRRDQRVWNSMPKVLGN